MSAKELTLVFLQLVLQAFFIKSANSQDVLFNLNTKKVVAVTSDKFLSLTLDPAVLLTGDVLTSSTELSTNMAKALAPGYVRLAGPKSNSFNFERSLFPQTGYEDPDLMFSEAHWVLVQQWAQRAGLDVVSSLTPQRIENEDQVTAWDPRNSLDLISFSDHMGYNISWQLGYECQIRCDISGFDLGKDVARLRNMLNAFPRYANSIIAGPDIVSFRGKQQQQFIQDYLISAGNALSVITWHPDFAGITLDSDGVALQMDTLAADKDLLYKSMGRLVAKKPLWIAESKPEECKRQFLGALVWARRLGNAAKLGVQVIMRQPDASNIIQPTPDYWVSLLHKTLVGKEVLDTKLTSGNKTHVYFYCQCTKPSAKYDRGSITIFGINLTPGKVSVSLKGLKIKAVHKYILMPGYDTDNRMFAETVLLNNEPLTLVNGKNLPEINPAVSSMGKNMAVRLPSGGIGFWVIPGARVKSCLGHDEEGTNDKNLLLKKLAKKLEEPEVTDENLGHELEDDNQNQELDVESTEDIKSLLKSKKKRRKYWHSDETDDEDRRFKRIDTKKELEKLEKLLKRNNNNNDEKKFKGKFGLAMFESDENKGENISDDDAGLMRFKKNEKATSGEEMKAKLEEYKNKLTRYETMKKNDEEIQRVPSKRISQLDEHSSNDLDTQKALEALALISRVEGAMREQGKPSEKIEYEENPKHLRSSDLVSDIGEEILIQELEKSDKIKRMIDPKTIGKIYQLFVNNDRDKVQKRSVEDVGTYDIREKRDLEKLLGDDPLGLRKDVLFRKRIKAEEIGKERRLERRNRKKEKEEIGIKKELLPVARYDPRITDSNENNFMGIPPMKPLQNFPEGDVYMDAGSSSEEKSHDYDYVRDDEDDEKMTQQQKRNKQRKTKNKKQSKVVQDETWVEEPNSNLQHAPNEFFERVKLPAVAIKSQWKDHGELYEPESLQPGDLKEMQKTNENDVPNDTVIVRDRPDDREDKKAKETAVKKLINYYDNSELLRNEHQDFERGKQRPRGLKNRQKSGRPDITTSQRKPKESLKVTNMPEEISNPKEQNTKRLFEPDMEYEDGSEITGSLEFVNSKAVEDYSDELPTTEEEGEIVAKKRTKRKISNLDIDIFKQEMIREDAGNLKDCKCRVIRSTGKLKCKNCKVLRRREREIAEANSKGTSTDTYPGIITDQSIIVEESPMEDENLTDIMMTEAPEINQEESDTRDVANSQDATTVLSESDNQSSQKYTEAADLNEDKKEEELPSDINNGDVSVAEPVTPLIENTDSQIGLEEPLESKSNDLNSEAQVISTGNEEEETKKAKSNDDIVGSQRLMEDDVANRDTEESGLDRKIILEEKNTVGIDQTVSGQDIGDENHAKRHISESSDTDLNTRSSTKISLGTGVDSRSSFKAQTLSESNLKNGLDLKLKSGGLKSEYTKSKFALNTEALSALMKENESKKAEVLKALETSSKLKSVDNSKYVEYQKKRSEKLSNLKDKLKERKAKILQQYRQELLDALSKCDDEVERNLKRREIWDDFSKQQEFQDFVDKDKLAYLMMNRPVNYEHIEESNNGFDRTEDRRYYPEIEMIQPIQSPRKQKVPTTEYHRYISSPKRIAQFSSSSEGSLGQDSSREDYQPLSDSRYTEDEPYYAIVESLENPKIFHKKHLEAFEKGFNKRHDAESNKVDYGDEGFLKQEELVSAKYNDHSVEEKFYLPEYQYQKNYDREKNVAKKHEEKRIFAIDRPILHVYNDEDDLTSEYTAVPYYKEFTERRENPLQKTYDQDVLQGIQNNRYAERDYSWDNMIPEYPNGILHHREYSRPYSYYPGSGQKLLRLKEIENVYRNRRASNEEDPDIVRNERHLIPHEKLQILDEPAYKIIPLDTRGNFPVRRERDVKEKYPNYVCVTEDSTEDFGVDDKRLFKLVRNEDHYEAVPISELPEESGSRRQRKKQRRVARNHEKVRNGRRKYNSDVSAGADVNHDAKNIVYLRRYSPKSQYMENGQLLKENNEGNSLGNIQNTYNNELEGKSHSGNHEIEYSLIGEERNRLESGHKISPGEYELLMLVPVEKHEIKRLKRDLNNNVIDRYENYEDMNKFRDDIIGSEENKNRLDQYIDAENKRWRDFEEAQANLNKYLKENESMQDPVQLKKFKKIISNLGEHDPDGMTVTAKSQDELDRIHLGEYLRQEILKKVDNNVADKIDEKSTTPGVSSATETSPSLFDMAIPKLENTINEGLEKAGNLTESLEDFINEFNQKLNSTSEIESKEAGTESPNKKDSISHSIFHAALNSVKKFFAFLTGVSLIFHRH